MFFDKKNNFEPYEKLKLALEDGYDGPQLHILEWKL
jgi:hypothetical protein